MLLFPAAERIGHPVVVRSKTSIAEVAQVFERGTDGQ